MYTVYIMLYSVFIVLTMFIQALEGQKVLAQTGEKNYMTAPPDCCNNRFYLFMLRSSSGWRAPNRSNSFLIISVWRVEKSAVTCVSVWKS